MFSALRKRMHLSPATAIASLVLVFAMSGGAFAAGKYLITSTKQIKPSVLASLKGSGKTGPAGAAGPQGPAGPAGAAGAKGENGAPGKEGPEGKEGKEGKQGTPGKNGTTGFTKTLPKGETETGAWSFSASEMFRCVEDTGKGNFTDSKCETKAATAGTGNFEKEPLEYGSGAAGTLVPITFNIPLAAKLDGAHVYYIEANGTNVSGTDEVFEVGGNKARASSPGCNGSAANPTAEPGYLCVYEVAGSGVELSFDNSQNVPTYLGPEIFSPGFIPQAFGDTEGEAGTNGAVIRFAPKSSVGERFGWGSWAVTAE